MTNVKQDETNGIPLVDTREKLEADIRRFYDEHECDELLSLDFLDVVFGWFDRQADITERETLHSHPMCAGSDACPALNRPIGEFADRETPDTAGIGTSKDEIRDFDVWNVAYEIYCAGGYVDNGNEPNPPTDGIRELLDRQAAITEREHPGLTIAEDKTLINWHGENYILQSKALNAERERDEFSLKLKHEMELNRNNRNAHDLERIADLEATVVELAEERDRLREQLDDFDSESYCGGTIEDWHACATREQARADEMAEKCQGLEEARDEALSKWRTALYEREELLKGIQKFECTHMLLPVDADGVPIRPGDTIHRTTSAVDNVVTVIGVNEREFFFNGPNFTEPGIKKNVGNAVRHVKPETVEGIIAEAMSFACEPEAPFSESSKHVKRFAERIRKAVER